MKLLVVSKAIQLENHLVCVFKNKGYVQECRNYRCIKLYNESLGGDRKKSKKKIAISENQSENSIVEPTNILWEN